MWRKDRNITLRNATWFGNLQIDFHLEDKKKVEIMDVLMSIVLSLTSTLFQCSLLSLKSILPPFCKRGN